MKQPVQENQSCETYVVLGDDEKNDEESEERLVCVL